MRRFLALAILEFVAISEAANSKSFASFWISQSSWVASPTSPQNNVYARSKEMCTMACLLDVNCGAFVFVEDEKCEFGSIPAESCLIVADKDDPGAMKVYGDKTLYGKAEVHEMHLVDFDDAPSGAGTINSVGCPVLLSIPNTTHPTVDNGPTLLVQYGKGILSCGGEATGYKECLYWQPGQAGWSPHSTMPVRHDFGSTAANLGGKGLIVVGHSTRIPKASILEPDGLTWTNTDFYPQQITDSFVFVKSHDVVYSFGGKSGSWSQKKSYRYDRQADTWTPLGDMIYKAHLPSCARTVFRNKDSILCFGGLDADNIDLPQVFDVASETWWAPADLPGPGPDAPTTVGYAFVRGNTFYRPSATSMVTFDLTSETWSDVIEIGPSVRTAERADSWKFAVRMDLHVVYKKG